MSGISDSGKKLGQKLTPRVQRYCRQDQIIVKKKQNDKQITEKSKNQSSGDGVFKTPPPLRRCSSLIAMSPSQKNMLEAQQSLKLPNEDERQAVHKRDNELSWRVLYNFTKHLANRRKQELDRLSQNIEKSNEMTSKLNIQVSLLKSIIKSDEVKREAWKKRLQEEKIVLDSTMQENNRLQMVKVFVIYGLLSIVWLLVLGGWHSKFPLEVKGSPANFYLNLSNNNSMVNISISDGSNQNIH